MVRNTVLKYIVDISILTWSFGMFGIFQMAFFPVSAGIALQDTVHRFDPNFLELNALHDNEPAIKQFDIINFLKK